MREESFKCWGCGEAVEPKRWERGHRVCMSCGESQATADRKNWCVAPMHKSNYMLITNPDDLTGLNNKGGIVK